MNTFFTNLNETELKEFLKQSLRDVLNEKPSKVPDFPNILDIKQAAEFLKLKINTLYEKTSRKQIPHFKKGNKLYFNRADLQEWIMKGKVKTNDEIESNALTHLLNRNKQV
jgi:excisionase family DNA binding protein